MKDYQSLVLSSIMEDLSSERNFNEDTDFEEGAGLFAESKFVNAVQKAVNATYALVRYAYGVEKDGKIYDIDRSQYSKFYHYLDRADFKKYKGGLSYDYCRFLYPYLKQCGYDTTLYFVEIEGTLINHVFPMIKVPYGNGSTGPVYVYLEAALKYIYGAYRVKDPDGIINAIVSYLKTLTIITKPTNVVIRKVTMPKEDDLSYDELLKKLRKFEVYDKYPIKPRNGSDVKGKAAKFDAGLLSNINPDVVRIK